MSDLHAGFQRADADARGDGLFAFLERVDGLPHVQAIKRRMTELLGPSAGQHLLEVGCGMGHEIRRLAGRVAPGEGRGGQTLEPPLLGDQGDDGIIHRRSGGRQFVGVSSARRRDPRCNYGNGVL